MTQSAPALHDQSLFKQAAFVDGKWLSAKSGKTFEVQDPASGNVIGSMPDMDEQDTESAIQAASEALPKFRKMTARERAHILHRWYELLEENADDLAKLITWENGKPLFEAVSEVKYAAHYFEWFSGEATRLDGETIPASVAAHRIYTIKEPVGVVALITPWNWPIGMVTRKVGPALAAGCTVVLKSPAETPFTAAAMAVLGQRAGVPDGVLNIVTAHQNTAKVGALLTSSPIIKKISFTGSTRVGKLLMKQASETLKKCSFELGGNAPFIVFDDADLEKAVEEAVACKFRSSGQTCVCANRIYVQRLIYDKFATALADKVKNFKIGPGSSKGVTHGPLINDQALEKSLEHTKDAREHGAKILTGGERMPELGPNFFKPAVIRDVTAKMKVAHEETFGPVAPLFVFDTEAEVIKLANDTDVGLAGFFFSRDVNRCYRIAEALEVGMVGVNTGIVSDPVMPFGGVKESGFGREGSKHGISEYITVKAVTLGGMNEPLQSS